MIRIGNCSGFYGDRLAAMREMLEGGPLDVLTGDYLAELTMLILARDRLRDPATGYAKTFLRQLEDCLGLAVSSGTKIVVNAGGLNPSGCADAVSALADRLGVPVKVGYVTGDELPADGALAANAYLGCWGIVECLRGGADVVVTGRVTDASLVVGPAAWHHDWARDDWKALAGATVAGHVLECGAQATGGNYSFFTEIDARRPGFPIAEIHRNGTSVITKHPGTGGAVTVDTVTAQLLYEVSGPAYWGPDVGVRIDRPLTQEGPDRVRIGPGEYLQAPRRVKVGHNRLAGHRNAMTFVLTGLDIEAKAALVKRQVRDGLGDRPPRDMVWTLARTDHPDAATEEEASALLHLVVRDPSAEVVGRAFSRVGIELALASYPGFHVTAPPADASPYGVFTSSLAPQETVDHVAVLPDGRRVPVPPPPGMMDDTFMGIDLVPPKPSGPTRRVPLGTIVGARSGDKGGMATIGLWARSDAAWEWLNSWVFWGGVRSLLPEFRGRRFQRFDMPRLRAYIVTIDGALGEGVAASTRFDPQGKGLGEYLRSRLVDIPEKLL